VPASVSSPIAVLSAHAGIEGVEPDADLLVALAAVPDPRKARGCRHQLVTVLAVSVCAVLAGARSYVSIAEWAHDLPVSARLRLRIGRQAPSESAIRRILQRVDSDALDAALSGWLAARTPPPQPGGMRVVAVDGKTARGARTEDRTQVHLLAAFDHAGGIVLGQTQIEGKSNEITAFVPLLDRLDLADVLVTADALHTQRGHADYLHTRRVKQLPSLTNRISAARAAAATYSWPLRMTCAPNGGCPNILIVMCPHCGSRMWKE
jgi:hypothetical protein